MHWCTAIDHWHRYLESGHDVCAVFLDFKKAFDSVMHEVLMNKLSALRLSPFLLRWIANYLTNPSQFVGTSSGTTPVVSGVPLGSILGPLLFLIYVNDITEIQLSGSHLLLYADDVLLYRPIQSQADYLLLQADIYIYILINYTCGLRVTFFISTLVSVDMIISRRHLLQPPSELKILDSIILKVDHLNT